MSEFNYDYKNILESVINYFDSKIKSDGEVAEIRCMLEGVKRLNESLNAANETAQAVVQPQFVVLEGNIGSGKTTMIEKLRNDPDFKDKIYVAEEPLEEWSDVLPMFYEDKEKWGVSLQVNVACAHFHNIQKCAGRSERLVILERDPSSCEIFSRAMGMKENELKIVQKLANYFTSAGKYTIPPIKERLVINTSPYECLRRITARNRDGEDKITLDYLMNLDLAHMLHLNDRYITHGEAITHFLNTHNDEEEIYQQIKKHLINQYSLLYISRCHCINHEG